MSYYQISVNSLYYRNLDWLDVKQRYISNTPMPHLPQSDKIRNMDRENCIKREFGARGLTVLTLSRVSRILRQCLGIMC